MKPYNTFLLPMSWYVYLHLFILTLMCFGPNRAVTVTLGNQTDHLALLQFNQLVSSDPYGILDSWNSSTHFCNWHGIICNPKHQRVTKLRLPSYKLYLNIGNNSYNGNIPQELGRLSKLGYLLLLNNSLVGEFPINLTKCYELKTIDLEGNNLIGKLPSQIGSLQKLQNFFIERNNLSRKIPPSIGNLSSLAVLSISYNNLVGNIPQEMCFLKHLWAIAVDVNKLSVAANNFSGSLPPNMFYTLPNLQYFTVGSNKFSGPIPTSISNASSLTLFEIGDNHFVGQVPSLGKLKDLYLLNLEMNILGDSSTMDLQFLKSLTNCSKLQSLSLTYNNFGGSLQNSIGNLSTTLDELKIGEGTIPTTFKKFQRIQWLRLDGNRFSGDIPDFIGNLSQLYYLRLDRNLLEGSIPLNIGNCQKLQYLDFSQNNLRGSIL
ncbi:LRR receptor-like kinase family protein [Medicago truncatula]|uniref:LRR receptor-like kinase family protein n=1 Tax=Medicago truncatula TaxID=3880 RepID=G7K5C5_MEDTR|nr:LRR receptor-like kinase family protein [Medicago truncatula]